MGGRGALDGVVPPHVDGVVPRDVLAGTPDHEHLLHGVAQAGGLLARLVDGRLERGRRTAAVAAVGGDHDLGLAVLEARGQRVGGEPAEDHGVRGADAGAGQHRDHGLGDHRHVDRDPVAGGHAHVGQCVGGLADQVLQLGVGDGAGVTDGLADEVDGDLVAAAGLDVAVHAVVGGVELAADVPLRERRVGPVEDLGEGLGPGQALRLLGPEALAVLRGGVVGVGGEVGVLREVRGRLEAAVLLEQVRQGLVVLLAHCVSPARRGGWDRVVGQGRGGGSWGRFVGEVVASLTLGRGVQPGHQGRGLPVAAGLQPAPRGTVASAVRRPRPPLGKGPWPPAAVEWLPGQSFPAWCWATRVVRPGYRISSTRSCICWLGFFVNCETAMVTAKLISMPIVPMPVGGIENSPSEPP